MKSNYQQFISSSNHPEINKPSTHIKSLICLIIIIIIILIQTIIYHIYSHKVKDEIIHQYEQKELLIKSKAAIQSFEMNYQQSEMRYASIASSRKGLYAREQNLKLQLTSLTTEKEKRVSMIDYVKKRHKFSQTFSTILNTHKFFALEKLTKCSLLEVCYRSSRDGFNPKVFHEKCDGYQPSITLIHTTNDAIFGGYTKVSWGGNELKYDPTAFLFSLSWERIYPIYDNMPAINTSPEKLPIFGEDDIIITGKDSTHRNILKSFKEIDNTSSSQSQKPIEIQEVEVYVVYKNEP